MWRAARVWRNAAAAILLLAFTAPDVRADVARWRQREFVIGGWNAGDPHYAGRLVELWRAGLNCIQNGDRNDRYDVERTARDLDSLRANVPGFDLRLIAQYRNTPEPERVMHNPDARSHRDVIARTVGRITLADSAAVEGWMVWDEPSTDAEFESAARLVALLDSLPATHGRLTWINLLPSYAYDDPAFAKRYGGDKAAAYQRYLDRVIAMYRAIELPPPLLSVDHYPFQIVPHRRDMFLTLRTLVRTAAKISATQPPPIWFSVQLSPWRGRDGVYRPEPTFAQARWQVSAALAYGAKGILYWVAAPGGSGEFAAALIDRQGHHAAAYDSVRALDRILRAWGPTLMRLVPVSVLHQSVGDAEGIGTDVFGAAGSPTSALSGMTGGGNQGMAGTLRDTTTGDDWVIVVNKSLSQPAQFVLTPAHAVAGVDAMGDDGATHALPLSSGRVTVPTLLPGTAALLHFRAP
jgi:hypothetical protein